VVSTKKRARNTKAKAKGSPSPAVLESIEMGIREDFLSPSQPLAHEFLMGVFGEKTSLLHYLHQFPLSYYAAG